MGGVKAAAEPDPFAAVNHPAHQIGRWIGGTYER